MSGSHHAKEIRTTERVSKHRVGESAAKRPAFEKTKLTMRQAERLSKLSGVPAPELAKLTIGEISEKYKYVIDPALLFFRKITGRVIKKDIAGNEYPVPFATVHVEDTDSKFLGYFPPSGPFSWLFPLATKREEIGTAITDECGRFTAYVPRFEIDWILRWRLDRYCYSDIFTRPSVLDALEEIREHVDMERVPRIPIPEPGPDPSPLAFADGGSTFRRVEELVGRDFAAKLATAESSLTFGSSPAKLSEVLNATFRAKGLAPPIPEDVRRMDAKELQGVAARMSARELPPMDVGSLPTRRWIGPLLRCKTVLVPTITPVFDVPDITFRVTQDVDGDGDEEVVYAEGYFDVRWNATSIPEVTLVATDIALAGVACDFPDVSCGSPGLAALGLMPILDPPVPEDPYHDATTGYAQRPNRPHANGLVVPDPGPLPRAEAPYTGTLQIYGCPHKAGAKYYRVLHGTSPGSLVPFTNTWKIYRFVGSPLHLEQRNVVPDANGWYEILPEDEGWMPHHLLMNWPTGTSDLYHVALQLGNASKSPIETQTPVAIRVDNSTPAAVFEELAWRVVGQPTWNVFPGLVCPVINRPKGADIEMRVKYSGSAEHLRAITLGASGCGGGAPSLHPPGDIAQAQHWHVHTGDNAEAKTAVFRLAGTAPPGAYGFHLNVTSRAFNPAGGDGGFEADWNYNPVYRYTHVSLPVSVVDVIAPGPPMAMPPMGH